MSGKLPFSLIRFRGPEWECWYNSERLREEQLAELLADKGERLLVDAKPISRTRNADSYRLERDGGAWFVKVLNVPQWYFRWRDRVSAPLVRRNMAAAERLLAEGLLTPAPVLGVRYLSGGRARQILVTDFCEEAVELDQYVRERGENLDWNGQMIPGLANLLVTFHRKGFYSRHLRAGNLLVEEVEGGLRFWFIDLDRMWRWRWANFTAFASTVSRTLADMYSYIPTSEQEALLTGILERAAEDGVLVGRGQQERWRRAVLRQIRRRNPRPR